MIRREKKRRDLLYDDPVDCGIYTLAKDRKALDETRTVSEVHRASSEIAAYGLFAGHGGATASELCARIFVPTLLDDEALKRNPEGAIRNACAALEAFVLAKSALDRTYYGTTLLFSLIQGQNLFVANIGNSRAVIATKDGIQAITQEHDGSNAEEVARVRNAGGFFQDGKVNNLIRVTRSIGDLEMKDRKHVTFPELKMTEDLVIATPDVFHRKLSARDEFLIMATAEVWETLSNKFIVQVIHDALRRGDSSRTCAKKVATAAIAGGARGPLTVMILIFPGSKTVPDKTANPPRRRTSRPSALKRHSSNAEQELRSRNNQAKIAAATPAFVLQAKAQEEKRLALEEKIIQSSPVTSPAGPKVIASGSGGSTSQYYGEDFQVAPFLSLDVPPASDAPRPSSKDGEAKEANHDASAKRKTRPQLPRAQSMLGVHKVVQATETSYLDDEEYDFAPSRRQIDLDRFAPRTRADELNYVASDINAADRAKPIVVSRISELTASGATGGADASDADLSPANEDIFDSNPSGPSKVRYREDGTVQGGRLGFLKEFSKTFVRRR